MSNIVFSNVTFSYDTSSTPLFNNISLCLEKGWTGVVGINGIGKSTFLKLCAGLLHPQFGHIQRPADVIYCNQKTDSPPYEFSSFLCFSRLGSLPEYLLSTSTPSPGEIRKLFLSMEMRYSPELIILDEPTNHLDITSIECLEQALLNCNCALLLVSHDQYFLDNLTSIRWHIINPAGECLRYKLLI